MEMKAGTRVVFTIYLVVIIVAGLFLLATMFGAVDGQYLDGIVNTLYDGSMGYKILYAAIIIVIIVVGICLIFFGLGKQTPKTARIASFENGSIVIAVRAIEELVERYVRETKHVKGLAHKVTSSGDDVDIDVQLSVMPNTDIPQITKDLKDGLKANIEAHTGITVKQVNVSVMGITDSLASLGGN